MRLDIKVRLNGKRVGDDDLQPIYVELSTSPAAGEYSIDSNLPFSANFLKLVLRILEIDESAPGVMFTVEQVKKLQTELKAIKKKSLDELRDREDEDEFKLTCEDIIHPNLQKMVFEKLFWALFPEESLAGELFSKMEDAKKWHLCLRLNVNTLSNPLFAYPWELLTLPNSDWFRKPITLSRYIGLKSTPPKLDIPNRLNVWVVTSRPRDMEAATGDDFGQIKAAWASSTKGQNIQVEVMRSGSLSNLIKRLSASKKEDWPHVLHFDGHGEFGRKCNVCESISRKKSEETCQDCGEKLEDNGSYLAFENDGGGVKWVSASDFEGLIQGYGIPLIFLNVCRGSRYEDSNPFDSLAYRLLKSSPAVVATPFRLDWDTAIKFAGAFYSELMESGLLLESMNKARHVLYAEDKPGWYRLALYLRWYDDEGGRLFSFAHSDAEPTLSVDGDLRQYQVKFAKRLENEAVDQIPGIESYIQNYITMNAGAYKIPPPDLEEVNPNASEDILHILHSLQHKQVMLLGEAGSGKTVALRRFAWELIRKDSKAIPVLLDLGNAGENIVDDVVYELKRHETFRHLESQDLKTFLQEGIHCYFLFDNFNLISPERQQALNDFLGNYPVRLVVIAGRLSQYALNRPSKVDEYLLLQPLSDQQIAACAPEFELDPQLYTIARNPTLLTFTKVVLEGAGTHIINRSDVFTKFVKRILNEGTLFQIAQHVPDTRKWDALQCLAFNLNLQHNIAIGESEAVNLVADELEIEHGLSQSILDAAILHGLLVVQGSQKGVRQIRFSPNLMMQEYFAAEELKKIAIEVAQSLSWKEFFSSDMLGNAFRKLWGSSRLKRLARDPWWTETFILLAGLLALQSQSSMPKPDWLIARLAMSWKSPWLAGWCIDVQGLNIEDEKIEEFAEFFAKYLTNTNPDKRYAAVETLLKMTPHKRPELPRTILPLMKAAGDEEPQVAKLACDGLVEFSGYANRLDQLCRKLMQKQPDIYLKGSRRVILRLKGEIESFPLGICPIPEGMFLMGSSNDPHAVIVETTLHEEYLHTYWLGKYPVTNMDYAVFVQQADYPPPKHWRCWMDGFPEGKEKHPVTFVSWYDACAYCYWLSDLTGYYVRLPTEGEWEKGARGTKGRRYPWGDEAPDPGKCNFLSEEVRPLVGTKPIGSQPLNCSPFGCIDMVGNINEWCLPRKPKSNIVPIRGGSYEDAVNAMRCAHRTEVAPEVAISTIGFRILITTDSLVRYIPTKTGYTVKWL